MKTQQRPKTLLRPKRLVASFVFFGLSCLSGVGFVYYLGTGLLPNGTWGDLALSIICLLLTIIFAWLGVCQVNPDNDDKEKVDYFHFS